MKTQGILPIYDPRRKQMLGIFLLPYSKTFTGDETQHNISFPDPSGPTNLVPVQKISLQGFSSNRQVKHNDWFMAAVFSYDEIRLQMYRGYANFYSLDDVAPRNEWVCCHSHSGQLREYLGPLLRGQMEDFTTGAPNEDTLAPPTPTAGPFDFPFTSSTNPVSFNFTF